MWSSVQATSVTIPTEEKSGLSRTYSGGSPATRSQHAMCCTADGHIYLLGGRSGKSPLKDLWRFDPGQNEWEEVKCRGHCPPSLQGHSVVSWDTKLYVFGGEVGSTNGETPLWILDLNCLFWRKQNSSPSNFATGSTGSGPCGRRAHSAVVYGDAIYVYGGYQDLRGSCSELWTLDLMNEQWHMVSCAGRGANIPVARHGHSAVVYGDHMWIYGGQTDLQERNDFWKWSFRKRTWTRVKPRVNKQGPGGLYNHTAVCAFGSMLVFGGETEGQLAHDVWRFHFDSEAWEKVNTEGMMPNARCLHTAVPNPFVEVQDELGFENSSSRTALQSLDNRKAAIKPMKHSKSISMCFGSGSAADSPLHQPQSAFRYMKGISKVHPAHDGLVSTVDEDEANGNSLPNVHYDSATAQVAVRRTLRDKIVRSRLVRSFSGSNYNVQGPFKDELERLVGAKEETPSPQRQVIESDVDSQRPRPKILKSRSSEAVLESDSESGTPIRSIPLDDCASRTVLEPPTRNAESISPTEIDALCELPPPSSNNKELELLLTSASLGSEWPAAEAAAAAAALKRHTVHESMSYYSLCFPSPPPHQKLVPYSAGASPSTPNDTSASSCLAQQQPPTPYCNRLSSVSSYEVRALGSLGDFEEEDGYEEDEVDGLSCSIVRSVRDVHLVNATNHRESALIDLADEVTSPIYASVIPISERQNYISSSYTLNTPNTESQCLSHSMSHCSSGYHSFADDAIMQQSRTDDAMTRNPFGANVTAGHQGVVFRKKNRNRNTFELRNVTNRTSLQDAPHVASCESSLMSNRTRSLDRKTVRTNAANVRNENSRPPWQPQINAIKEVVVPSSPAVRKWTSATPVKGHAHDWRLAMMVFGGREQGVSSILKQPISIWKLYI
ncbi:Leucine-zipper-like transcriptional regulator 1 [Halotydeus destructor]|nr:Leucine-zipper-like transcriptional regulator 1 [Halotydeus destructor]